MDSDSDRNQKTIPVHNTAHTIPMHYLYLLVLAENRKSCLQYYRYRNNRTTQRVVKYERKLCTVPGYQLQKLVKIKNPLRTASALTQQKNSKTAR